MPVKNRLLQGTILQPQALEAPLWHIPEITQGILGCIHQTEDFPWIQ